MYLLDIKKLHTGDIILTRDDSELSLKVRKRTKSEYSHAMLYVGTSSYIESDGNGVQAQNIQRLLSNKLEDTKVLRLKKDYQTKNFQQIIDFAREKIGTEYSLDEAKYSIVRQDNGAKLPNRQFCTRFVSQAYEFAGIRIVENPDYCTMNDILTSDLLEEIKDVIKVADENEIAFAQSENPIEIQTQIYKAILSEARTLTGADIQTFEQLSKYVLDNPDKEAEITHIIENSGYFTMWQDEVKNPWHYDYSKFIEYYKYPEQIIKAALFFADSEKNTRKRFEVTLQALNYGYSLYSQKFFLIQIDLYKKLIELSLEREKTALKILDELKTKLNDSIANEK